MKLLPQKEEDTLQKLLSMGLIPIKAIMKGVSVIPNKLMKTDQKIAEMRENIDELSLEDFQILVQSPEKVNKMFHSHVKDTFDKDYLDPQFMKQYKVNNAYLDVVRQRLGRERNSSIEFYNQQAKEAQKTMQELEEIGQANWTKEQQTQYIENVKIFQDSVEEGKKYQTELDQFDEGAKKKSSSYRNISGWFLGKFNPDNRKQNAKMAELAKNRREVAKLGNEVEVSAITGKMQKISKENTKIKGRRKNRIDIGLYSIESPIEILDKGQQNKGRLLLSNIAIITSIMGLAKQVRENIENKEIVATHNEQLERINKENQNRQVSGQVKISDSPMAKETQEVITKQSINAGFNQAERTNVQVNEFGATYIQKDMQIHAQASQATTEAQNLLNQGETLQALKTAANYYTKVQKDTQKPMTDYVASHPQFDYSAYTFASKADINKIYDFFEKGVIPYQTNINSALAKAMPELHSQVDKTATIFSLANSLYQTQKEGTKDIRKELKLPKDKKQEKKTQFEETKKKSKDKKQNKKKKKDKER